MARRINLYIPGPTGATGPTGPTGPAGPSGEMSGPVASVDGEVALYSGVTGKILKRATASGIPKLTSGVLDAAVAGTDYYNPGGTDVAVADGGTGASNAATARTNLGLIIGTNVQAWDADLDALAAIAGVQGDIIYHNGTNWVRLPKGTSLQGLRMNSGATAPEWAAAGGSGLVLVSGPTSFSAAASASLPANIFSSTYRRYILKCRAALSANAAFNFRFRTAGVDDATNSYYSPTFFQSASSATGLSGATAGTSGFVHSAPGAINSISYFSMEIDGPQVVDTTQWIAETSSRASGGGNTRFINSGVFNANTQFDSISIFPGSGTMTGTYSLYALADV